MAWRIIFTEKAKEGLRSLHIEAQRRVKNEVKRVAICECGGKPLVERLSGFYSIRVGNYRVIYSIGSGTMTIHYVGHRRDAYKHAMDS